MLEIWLAFLGGLIIGWLIEWIVDWQFWRKSVVSLRAENAELRRHLKAAAAASSATSTADATAASAPAANAPEGK